MPKSLRSSNATYTITAYNGYVMISKEIDGSTVDQFITISADLIKPIGEYLISISDNTIKLEIENLKNQITGFNLSIMLYKDKIGEITNKIKELEKLL